VQILEFKIRRIQTPFPLGLYLRHLERHSFGVSHWSCFSFESDLRPLGPYPVQARAIECHFYIFSVFGNGPSRIRTRRRNNSGMSSPGLKTLSRGLSLRRRYLSARVAICAVQHLPAGDMSAFLLMRGIMLPEASPLILGHILSFLRHYRGLQPNASISS
jgi:hypothetical protein